MRPSRLAVLALGLASAALAQEPKGSGTVVLHAARLIDGTGSPPIANGVVVITEDKIVGVGKAGTVAIPAGARTIELGDATLLPGFIDVHTHIIGRALSDPKSDEASRTIIPGTTRSSASRTRARH
jgi:Imidazolonepropionase and related amidohydrolases